MPRSRLIDKLNDGLTTFGGTFARKLTLISAPAGYGKTTLAAEWLQDRMLPEHDVAWLSLDEVDDDPASFYRYLEATLQRIGIESGSATAALSQSARPPSPESLAGRLINEIAASARTICLALDDYHHISDQAIHEAISFLIEHQPSQMHLAIITREDPPISLARLRGRGEMAEIRQDDLRFQEEEIKAFLNQVANLSLDPGHIAALEARTEGWIAGLQLAALALQGAGKDNDDVDRFVRSFAGSNRFILDYLIEEVFHRQPPEIQNFLLRTAVLKRMCAPLCDAVLAELCSANTPTPSHPHTTSQAILESLERANLFIIPLDDRRGWYRYHHLFADLLRYRLQQEGLEPDILHRRASQWYEANGFVADAVHHALAAGDWRRATVLVNEASERLLQQGQVTTLLRWIRALPEKAFQAQPELYFNASWALVLSGRLGEAENILALLEPVVEKQPAVYVDWLTLHAYIARARHDVPRTIELSSKALSLLPADDHNAHSVLGVSLGAAHVYGGDLKEAMAVWEKAARDGQLAGNHHARALSLSFMGQIMAAWGKLHQAADLHREAIRLGEEQEALPVAARAHVNLASLSYEWNDLAAAGRHLEQALELSRYVGDQHMQRDAYRILALVQQARGDIRGAQGALRKVDDLLHVDDVPENGHLAGAITHLQVALAQDDLATATRWAERIGVITGQSDAIRPDLLTNAGCFSPQLALIQARLLLEEGRKETAASLLDACCQKAREDKFGYSLVKGRILQALATPDPVAAFNFLADALSLAQPEGYLRTFVDEGEPIAILLDELKSRDASYGSYIDQILLAFGDQAPEVLPDEVAPLSAQPHTASPVEPLSDRELQILYLLAEHLTNAEIAQALVVSLNTVKTHLRHIYEKLDVHDRRAAVVRARELNLLN